jgi:hypothetical protein
MAARLSRCVTVGAHARVCPSLSPQRGCAAKASLSYSFDNDGILFLPAVPCDLARKFCFFYLKLPLSSHFFWLSKGVKQEGVFFCLWRGRGGKNGGGGTRGAAKHFLRAQLTTTTPPALLLKTKVFP